MSPELLERMHPMVDTNRHLLSVGGTNPKRRNTLERFFDVINELQKCCGVEENHLWALRKILGCLWGHGFAMTGEFQRMSAGVLVPDIIRVIDTVGTNYCFLPNHAIWSGAYSLLEVEWLTRVWTYQELKLTKCTFSFSPMALMGF